MYFGRGSGVNPESRGRQALSRKTRPSPKAQKIDARKGVSHQCQTLAIVLWFSTVTETRGYSTMVLCHSIYSPALNAAKSDLFAVDSWYHSTVANIEWGSLSLISQRCY